LALTYRIDPWASEYESALQLDDQPDEGGPEVPVRLDVEMDEWRLVVPEFTPLPSPVAFIDGVQRIELRVIGEDKGATFHGAFVSLGVGAALAGSDEPHLKPERPLRALALGSGASGDPPSVRCGEIILQFHVQSGPSPGYAGVKEALDRYRRDCETELGRRLVEQGYELVVMDGRLRFTPAGGQAVGMTKTLHRRYLPSAEDGILRDLGRGTRTPVFEIRSSHNPVYSWYIRLADPRPADYQLAAVVRLEAMSNIGIEAAVRLADLTTVHLPRFASSPIWDARAPQNLYPFAALEQRLRHELGDHLWVRRAIEAYIIGGGP